MSVPALEITGLNKNFGALAVAQNIDFRLQGGARQALIGPNGAGKTTFIDLITGALAPTSGRVYLNGVDVTRESQWQRSRRGLTRTFQINQLFRGLSVLDNVCLAVAERTSAARSWLRPRGHRSEVGDEAIELLRALRLHDAALTLVGELPYGRQRLVEIVIALAQRPRVLLLDEPSAGVPSSEAGLILDVIEGLDKDISVLIIEHDMELVFRFAERITVLDSGRILAEGAPDEIATDARVRAVYLGGASRE